MIEELNYFKIIVPNDWYQDHVGRVFKGVYVESSPKKFSFFLVKDPRVSFHPLFVDPTHVEIIEAPSDELKRSLDIYTLTGDLQDRLEAFLDETAESIMGRDGNPTRVLDLLDLVKSLPQAREVP